MYKCSLFSFTGLKHCIVYCWLLNLRLGSQCLFYALPQLRCMKVYYEGGVQNGARRTGRLLLGFKSLTVDTGRYLLGPVYVLIILWVRLHTNWRDSRLPTITRLHWMNRREREREREREGERERPKYAELLGWTTSGDQQAQTNRKISFIDYTMLLFSLIRTYLASIKSTHIMIYYTVLTIYQTHCVKG